MIEFDFGDSEGFKKLINFLENSIVTKLTIDTALNSFPLAC